MMCKEKNNNSENDQNKVEESETIYDDKRVVFFNSFEEEAEYTARQRAALSYDERMEHIEKLRKRVFHQYLLPDGSWPSITRRFKIMEPYVNKPGK